MKSIYGGDLSFVIIGRNAEWSIARLLDSVTAYTPRNIESEIIYVDSASIDRTLEIVERYPVRILQLSPEQPLCASAGRYIGSRYAIGRYIAFVDSDMELVEGWLQEALRILDSHPEVAVVSGVQVDSAPERLPAREKIGGPDVFKDLLTEIKFAGSAAIFRHEVLDIAGTWNPYIVSDEEPELCLRIRHAGYRIVELGCPSVLHFGYARPAISALLARRKRRLFLGYGQVMRYHLRTGLLSPYLKERGWVVAPALVALGAIAALVASSISGNAFWIASFFLVAALTFAVDALRSRSLYKAIFHAIHRILILEGTIKGFLIHPHAPSEYPRDEREVSAYTSSIEPAISEQRSA